MQNFLHTKTLFEIFSDLHGKSGKALNCNISCKSQLQSEPFQVEGGMTVGDVVNFGIRYIEMSCIEDPLGKCLEQSIKAANVEAVNAFQLLMAGGRGYPTPKNER